MLNERKDSWKLDWSSGILRLTIFGTSLSDMLDALIQEDVERIIELSDCCC